MLFIIDIDQTIATGVDAPGFYAAVKHYRNLGIVIPETISDYHSLFQMPEVMRHHDPLPGAIEGVNYLAHVGRVEYYTVRKGTDRQLIEETTQRWLTEKGFPNPGNVIFCRSVMHKLVTMHEREKDSQEPIIFIDDRYTQAIDAFAQIAAGEYHHITDSLRGRLSIGAFGATIVPESSVIPLMALPSWTHVADLIATLSPVG